MSDSSATKEEENRITALIHMDQSRSQIVEGGCYHTFAAWTFEFQAGSHLTPVARRWTDCRHDCRTDSHTRPRTLAPVLKKVTNGSASG